MDTDRNNQIIRVAKMYYIDQIPQNRIAEREGISKPTVSRLIKKAHELGYVRINIIQPNALTLDMEARITKKYDLKTVKIFSPTEEITNSSHRLFRGLIKDLKDLVVSNTRIAITWNSDYNLFSKILVETVPEIKQHCRVVQLNGCLSPNLEPFNPGEFTLLLARLFNAKAIQVCSLPIFEQRKTVKMLRIDDPIKSVLDYAANSDIAVISPELIGSSDNLLVRGGLKMKDIEYLKKEGAEGIICGHVLNKRGKIADYNFDQRIVAVPLNEIERIPDKILFSTSPDQADFIQVLCENNLVDRLYITEEVAQKFNF